MHFDISCIKIIQYPFYWLTMQNPVSIAMSLHLFLFFIVIAIISQKVLENKTLDKN